VWSTDGRFLTPDEARRAPLKVASANWHALATYAGRAAPEGSALLIDVGSTTTDFIPLLAGKPAPTGRTDPERLASGELYYAGVRRTPLMTLMDGAAEHFATTLDALLVLGMLPEDPADLDTADGRPATRSCAHARLARMRLADLETTTEAERIGLAREVHFRLVMRLGLALEGVARRMPGPPRRVVLAGSGEFLGRQVLLAQKAFPPCEVVSLAGDLGPAVSTAACAFAVAILSAEEKG
jgi:probable H4MPT-linked C1 transfer pathway protein